MATVIAIDGRQETGKVQRPRPGFMVLPSVERMFKAFDMCRENGWLGVVTAPSGFGKTTAIERYTEPRRYVRHMTAISVTEQAERKKNSNGFLKRMLGCWERNVAVNMPIYQVYEQIQANLRNRYYGRSLLIIDEANLLHRTSLQAVRDLYDASGAGFVLIGTPGLDDKLRMLRNSDGETYAPLVNRIRLWTALNLEKEDVLAMIEPYGLDAACRRFILAAANRNGALRAANGLLQTADHLAGDGPIGLQHLQAAAAINGAGGQP